MSRLLEGYPVADAVKPAVIEIKNYDVARADIKKPDGCAVARACLREFDKVVSVRVHLSRVYLKIHVKGNTFVWVRYTTPINLRAEIISFDRSRQFQPGVFTLAPPTKTKKIGKQTGSNTRPKTPTGATRQPARVLKGVRGHAIYF